METSPAFHQYTVYKTGNNTPPRIAALNRVNTPRAVVDKMSSTNSVPPAQKENAKLPPKGFDKEKLIQTVKTLQFGWFFGHVLTVVGSLLYLLTYLGVFGGAYQAFYLVTLFGVSVSFAILVFQKATKGNNYVAVIKDENTQYLLFAITFLILRPYVLLPILPFTIFSIFHTLTYIEGTLLPIFAAKKPEAISQAITKFTSAYYAKSNELASLLEVYSLGFLFIRVLTFRSNSLMVFLSYFVFIKIRFEHSQLTRNYIKTVELQVDELVNTVQVPVIKQSWVNFKNALRKIGGIHLVNDYTKVAPEAAKQQ